MKGVQPQTCCHTQEIKFVIVAINFGKWEFRKNHMKFLGHVINQQVIQADLNQTSALREIWPPANLGELKQFLGMVN